jgi:hypothetical protein
VETYPLVDADMPMHGPAADAQPAWSMPTAGEPRTVFTHASDHS